MCAIRCQAVVALERAVRLGVAEPLPTAHPRATNARAAATDARSRPSSTRSTFTFGPMLRVRQEQVTELVELVLRLLVIVVTPDVEPVVLRGPGPDGLAGVDKTQHQVGKVEALSRRDKLRTLGAKQYTPIEAMYESLGFSM